MKPHTSYTHKVCKLELKVTVPDDPKEKIFIITEKAGMCKSVMWEVIAKLANCLPRDQVLKIFKGYTCHQAIAGCKSCFDDITKMIEGKWDAK